jgi:hypothetical protein
MTTIQPVWNDLVRYAVSSQREISVATTFVSLLWVSGRPCRGSFRVLFSFGPLGRITDRWSWLRFLLTHQVPHGDLMSHHQGTREVVVPTRIDDIWTTTVGGKV